MNLTLKQLSFAYRGSPQLLHALDTSLADGELTALLGVNGSGKSTLLKLIAGILKPGRGDIVLGAPLKRSLRQLGPRHIARYCAYVAQNTHPSVLSVFDYVLLGRLPHQHGFSARASSYDLDVVEQSLEHMELTSLADRSMTRLSGGQIQMAVLARALAQQPAILLLDEPTSNLDPRHQVLLMDKLRGASQEHGTTVIFSMHDVNLALQWADQVLLLHKGELLRHIPTDQLSTTDLSTLFDLSYQEHDTEKGQRWFRPRIDQGI
ncbi:MAG: ABC transporter ATP-binding protein [Desulfuromonadaceae bacterium]|nr:ABC transporter ATP-binding protein [Desulfuromonadaceae bacterium]